MDNSSLESVFMGFAMEPIPARSNNLNNLEDGFESDAELAPKGELEWDGPKDPDNPQNWPVGMKIYACIVPVISVLVVSLFLSIYVAGVPQIMFKYKVSQTTAIAGLSVSVFGIGLGPMIGAPISETKGRVMVYRISMVLFALFTLGCALSKNISALLACRFLAATFGSPAVAVGAGTVGDVFNLQDTAATVGNAFLMMALLGPSLGPIFGGFIAEKFEWHWTMWTILILTAPVLLSLVFAKETYKKIILEKRAIARGIQLPPKPPASESLKKLFTVVMKRPIVMMFTEPMVAFTAIYCAFVYALVFLLFEAVPYVMVRVYHFNLSQTGSCFAGVAIGILFAGVMFYMFDRIFYQPARHRAIRSGQPPCPEERLYSAMVGSVILIIGLFWFAWLAKPEVHWIVPLIGVVMFGWGMYAIFVSNVMYILDAYDSMVSASALAANGMCRYTLGAIFPLIATRMYDNLGREWAGSLLGFIAIGLMPVPFILFKYGDRMRARSKYISNSESSRPISFCNPAFKSTSTVDFNASTEYVGNSTFRGQM